MECGRHASTGETIYKHRHRRKGGPGLLWATYRETTEEDAAVRRKEGGGLKKTGEGHIVGETG